MANNSVVLITGGNTGIGYEAVKALYAAPDAHTILMGSRAVDKAESAISTLKSEIPNSKSEVFAVQIDIEDDVSIEKCYKEVENKWGRVDALVNNAGASFDRLMADDPSSSGIRAAWNKAYNVNVTSTQAFTSHFIPLLLKSSSPRLLFITSGLSSLTTCSGGRQSAQISGSIPKGWPKKSPPSQVAYRSSKTALNMMMLDWHRLLQVDGVHVFCISPGFLATGLGGIGADMLRKFGAGEPSAGGEVIRDVVLGKRDADAGKVVNKDGVQEW